MDRAGIDFRPLLQQLQAEGHEAADQVLLERLSERPEPDKPARFVVRVAPDAAMDEDGTPKALDAVRGTFDTPAGTPPGHVLLEPMFPDAAAPRLLRYWLVSTTLARSECRRHGHDLAYALRRLPDVESAYYEDTFEDFLPLSGGGRPFRRGDQGAGERWAAADWSRRLVHADPETGGGGAGVRIAHPDTGWHEHYELDREALDLAHAANVTEEATTSSAVDPLWPAVPGLFPGHGTGTASVLVSRHAPGRDVLGIAPRATLVPIRCSPTVVSISGANVGRAFAHAIRIGAHVISLSMGGFPSRHLEEPLKAAVYEHGMIVCAAAGNKIPRTVFPASYPECICVAACTPSARPWSGSSHGAPVDIAAPGSCVWAADFDVDDPIVIAGGGTSYATPHVAGAAALWLAHHGRESLLEAYPQEEVSLQDVFRHLLRTTCWTPDTWPPDDDRREENVENVSEWDSSLYGPGILNIEALLDADLPRPEAVPHVDPSDRFEPMQLEDVVDVIVPGLGTPLAELVRRIAGPRAEEVGIPSDDVLRVVSPELSRLTMRRADDLSGRPADSALELIRPLASDTLQTLLQT